MHATFYSDEACSVATGQASEFTSSEFLGLYGMNETCISFFDAIFFGLRCINGNLIWALFNGSDSTCSMDVLATIGDGLGCEESASNMSTLGAYLEANCTEIVDDSGNGEANIALTADSGHHSNGRLSLYLVWFTFYCSWSIAASAAAALASALV